MTTLADPDYPMPSVTDYDRQVERYETTFRFLAERGEEPSPVLVRGYHRLLKRGPGGDGDTVSRETLCA